MKRILKLFIFQLKLHYKVILTWGVVLSAIMCLYMSFFSTMQELAQAKFEMLPTQYLQLLGMESMSELSNYNNFFVIIFNLLIIVISLFGSTFAVGIIRNEEKHNTIEFLYSLPFSRLDIYISKLLLVLLAVISVTLLTATSGIMVGLIVADNTFTASLLLKTSILSTIIPVLFSAIMFLFTAVTSKYSTNGLACGIVMFTYLLGYLGKLLENKGEWLLYFSPFEIYSPSKILANDISNTAFYIALTIIIFAIACGYLAYNKRDYNL